MIDTLRKWIGFTVPPGDAFVSSYLLQWLGAIENIMGDSSNKKGLELEEEVHDILLGLKEHCPNRVTVKRQRLIGDVPRPHRPDFELHYISAGLENVHLIECQDRVKSSNSLADKIFTVRTIGKHNRYVIIHRRKDALSPQHQTRLKEMGVLVYDLESFKAWIEEVRLDLEKLSERAPRPKYVPQIDYSTIALPPNPPPRKPEEVLDPFIQTDFSPPDPLYLPQYVTTEQATSQHDRTPRRQRTRIRRLILFLLLAMLVVVCAFVWGDDIAAWF